MIACCTQSQHGTSNDHHLTKTTVNFGHSCPANESLGVGCFANSSNRVISRSTLCVGSVHFLHASKSTPSPIIETFGLNGPLGPFRANTFCVFSFFSIAVSVVQKRSLNFFVSVELVPTYETIQRPLAFPPEIRLSLPSETGPCTPGLLWQRGNKKECGNQTCAYSLHMMKSSSLR